MFKVDAKVNLDPISKQISKNTKTANKKLLAQVALDTNRYVPMLSGDLRATQKLIKGGITWQNQYALAQFYGTNGLVNFRNYTTAGTGKRWDLKAQGVHGSSWEELVRGCY